MLIGIQKEEFKFEIPCNYRIISNINDAEKMAELYQQMNVLAVTSTLETFPTTLMEASCCGASLIGFNVGGIREIIVPFTGQLITPFNIENFAEGIQHFIENKMDKLLLSEYSQEKFGNEKMVKAYKDLYREKLTQQ
jgi:glycosyltransferase involved in cell wall biosynthesis